MTLQKWGFSCLLVVTAWTSNALNAGTVSLNGNWESSCLTDRNGQSTKQRASVPDEASNKVSFTIHHFADEACGVETYSFEWQADFFLGREEAAGVYPIDFTLNLILVTPKTRAQSDDFNATQFCGLVGWAPGEKKEVTGLTCGSNRLGSAGFQAYNRLKIDGDRMYLDFNASSASPTRRPGVSEFYFRRVHGEARPLQNDLSGTWKENCIFNSSSGGASALLTLDGRGSGSLDFHFFGDRQCQLAFFNGLSNVTLTLGSELRDQTIANGFPTFEADVSFLNFRYLLHTPRLAQNYRQTNYCGISDWEPGIEFDVTGRLCGSRQMPERGHMYYTVIGIKDQGSIFLGQPTRGNDGGTPETRAIKIVTERIMHKQ